MTKFPPDRFIAKPEVITMTGLSASSIWRRERLPAGHPDHFPSRIALSRNRVAWRLSEVLEWMSRTAENNRYPACAPGAREWRGGRAGNAE